MDTLNPFIFLLGLFALFVFFIALTSGNKTANQYRPGMTQRTAPVVPGQTADPYFQQNADPYFQQNQQTAPARGGSNLGIQKY